MSTRPARKKRKGTIALAAARTLTSRALEMGFGQQRDLVIAIERWLDNGHNLDTADIEWLADVVTNRSVVVTVTEEVSE